MSSYYARIKYDGCTTCEDVNISTGPSKWVHNTDQEHDKACFSQNGPRGTRTMASSYNDVNYPQGVDIESSLRGLDIPLSRCIDKRTLIERDIKLNKLYTDAEKRNRGHDCNPNATDLQYTRLNPYTNITETAFNRYEFPIIDPVNWVFDGHNSGPFITNTKDPNRSGRSTRHDYKVKIDPYLKALRLEAKKSGPIVAQNSWY